MKEVQIWRTLEKKCFLEWRGSAPDFFRVCGLEQRRVHFFAWVQDLFLRSAFPGMESNGMEGNVLRGGLEIKAKSFQIRDPMGLFYNLPGMVLYADRIKVKF